MSSEKGWNHCDDDPFFQFFFHTADPSLLLREGVIIDVNPAAVSLFKASSKDALLSLALSDLTPCSGYQNPEVIESIARQALNDGSFRVNWKFLRLNGDALSAEVLFTCITGYEESLLHAAVHEIPGTGLPEGILIIERDLSIALETATELDVALRMILAAACRIEGIDCGGVYLLDPSLSVLIMQAHVGLSDSFVENTQNIPVDTPGLEPVLGGNPLYSIPSALNHDDDDIRIGEGLHAVGSIPIRTGTEVIGTLNIGSHTLDEFPPEVKMGVEVLASEIGGVISRINGASALAESRGNLQLFFDTIEDFLFIIDYDGKIVAVNPAVLARLGYSHDELMTMHVRDLHPPGAYEEVVATFAGMLQGIERVCKTPLQTRNGEIIRVETRITRGTWSGRPVIFGISRDISEQYSLEQQLMETLDLNEKIISSSLLGIMAFRADTGRCVMANEASLKIIGGTRDEVINRDFREIQSWISSPFLQAAEEALTTGREQRAGQKIVTRFGKEIWVDAIFVPFTSNHHLHLLLIFDDVSERKKFDEEVGKREGILDSIARASRSFLSHPDTDLAIETLLNDLGTVMNVDRVYIFENHQDPQTRELMTSQRYEWSAMIPDAQINNPDLQNIPFSFVPEWERELSQGRFISGKVADFEPGLREFLEAQSITSILVVPIHIGDDFWGFIGFDDCHRVREWSATETTVLLVAADIIGGAIGRQKSVMLMHEARQQLADIIDHLPDATLVINREGVVTAWNRAMEELTGFDASRMLGEGNYEYAIPFYGERRPILIDYAMNPDISLTPEDAYTLIIDSALSGETVLSHPDKTRHLSARATLIKNQEGRVIGAIESIRDITWKVEAEQKILEYTRSLEEKNTALDTLSATLIKLNLELDNRVKERTSEISRLLQIKSDLISHIGHDLKTPLTPIIALLPEVIDQIRDPEQIEALTIIRRSADRLQRVVSTVLEYSQIDNYLYAREKTGCSLMEIFDQAILDNNEDIRRKNLHVESCIPVGMTVSIAQTHAETLAMNLISNAVKYTNPGGQILVEAVWNDEGHGVCVSDTGIGMTPDECTRVFDEFYRADYSRHDGTSCGLGLTIVSRIVSLYGGRITAHSGGPGKGSRFCILLDSDKIHLSD